jgi:tetratricopeptide (TPR) repeat protein
MNIEDRAMTCDEVVNGEIVEKYVLDDLTEVTRSAFEQHYFECGRCFELLQTYRAIKAELAQSREAAETEAPRKSWGWLWTWAPAMAVVVMTVGIGVLLRTQREMPDAPSIPPAAGGTQPSPTPAQPAPSPPASMPSIELLARVEPPPFVASRLRSADEVTARFNEAMAHYQRQNWAAAIPGLQAASKLDPEAAHIAFFLGASQLLNGQSRLAIAELRRTIALGESPFLEEAHFYLAKAHLQTRNVDEAIKELERTIQLDGERQEEARQLLGAIRRAAPSGH